MYISRMTSRAIIPQSACLVSRFNPHLQINFRRTKSQHVSRRSGHFSLSKKRRLNNSDPPWSRSGSHTQMINSHLVRVVVSPRLRSHYYSIVDRVKTQLTRRSGRRRTRRGHRVWSIKREIHRNLLTLFEIVTRNNFSKRIIEIFGTRYNLWTAIISLNC